VAFDHINADDDVRWTPYSVEAVADRAPHGLSTLCTRDGQYWLTRAPLVFDLIVEEYAPHRVMRQFGLHQEFPLDNTTVVTPAAHS
jgi:hypothetical protein